MGPFKPKGVIAVLGNGFTLEGTPPNHVLSGLNKAAEMYHNAPKDEKPISGVWGQWSFWHRRGTPPPTTESEAGAKYLSEQGVAEEHILKIPNSGQDTVGAGLTFERFVRENRIRNVTIICADFHRERVEYIFKRILGDMYHVEFVETKGPFEGRELELQKAKQRNLLHEQIPFLEHLLQNPHLVEHMYELPYYTRQLKGEINDTGKIALGMGFETSLVAGYSRK